MIYNLSNWVLNYNEKIYEELFKNACKRHDEIVIKNNEMFIKHNDITALSPQKQTEIRSTLYSYLLDTEKEQISIVEKLVYDIATFHFKRKEILFDKSKHYIQFWFKSINYTGCNSYHLDWNYEINNIKKTSFLTCIIYFDENDYPTVITNIDEQKYLSNELNDGELCFSFPKKNTHITFEGGKYYHGLCNIEQDFSKKNQRNMLIINLWDNYQPNNVPFFNNSAFSLENIYTKNDSIFSLTQKNCIKYIADENKRKIIDTYLKKKFYYTNIYISHNEPTLEFKELFENIDKDHDNMIIFT